MTTILVKNTAEISIEEIATKLAHECNDTQSLFLDMFFNSITLLPHANAGEAQLAFIADEVCADTIVCMEKIIWFYRNNETNKE